MKRLLTGVIVLAGCSPHVNKCKDKTLFVSVTLDDTTKSADQIVVDLSVDGGTPVHGTLAHQPGQAMGGVEVQFPKGYPTGHMIAVSLTATLAGATVGSGSASVQLAGGCDALSLTVSGATSQDLSGNSTDDLLHPTDLPGADTLPAGDGGSVDMNHSDLNNPDLKPVCVPENCFNNTDDDCDGLIDCADPDCVGGGSAPAICVPNPQGFTAGVTVLGASTACPAAWPSPAPINSGIQANCSNGCTGCNTPNNKCELILYNNAADSTCGAASGWIVQDTCFAGEDVMISGYHSVSPPTWTGDCGSPSGTSNKITPTWSNSERFCSGGLVGGGCASGSICVPAGPNHCVVTSGLIGATSCPPNYVKRNTQYYSGFDESKRSCNCLCTYSTPGSCSGSSVPVLYDTVGCTGTSTIVFGACSNTDISSFHYPVLSGPLTVDNGPGGCASIPLSSADPSSGEQTVCCTP